MGAQKADDLPLVLNTWLVTQYLHGDRPGGLPNDFLSAGSAALLIFDEVWCDEDGLDAEERFEKTWLSSDLFMRLKRAGILVPKKLSRFMYDEVCQLVLQSGKFDSVRDAMQAELAKIRNRPSEVWDAPLLPEVMELNRLLFCALDLPDCLRYDYQGGLFAQLVRSQQHVQARPASRGAKSVRDPQHEFEECLSLLAPGFHLLPELPASVRPRLEQNIAAERGNLYRWIYGDHDMPRDEYHKFRLGGNFRASDTAIDDERRSQADRNWDVLRWARDKTKDLRPQIRQTLLAVRRGASTVTDVKADLDKQLRELSQCLPDDMGAARWGLILAGVGLALTGLAYSADVVDPTGTASALLRTAAGGLRVSGGVSATARYYRARALRRRYPLALFVREFEIAVNKQRPKPGTVTCLHGKK